MKDFEKKMGRVEAFLLDCAPGGSCVLIDQASKDSSPWTQSDSWAQSSIDFGSVTYSLASNRVLALKLVVGNDSDDDMWFAYDTTSYPSELSVQQDVSTTTTTSTTSTTTAPAITPTAITPPPASSTTTVTTVVATTTTTETSTTTPIAATGPGGRGPVAGGQGLGALVEALPQNQPASTGVNLEAADPLLAAMGSRDGALTVSSFLANSWTGSMIQGLELVIPPWAVGVVTSPLMVLGFVLDAMTDSGKAIMLPLTLLMAGMLWVVFENRAVTLTVIRRSRERRGESQ